MIESKAQEIQLEEKCRSWVIYGSSEKGLSNIQRDVDKIFSGYSFYPEIDWGQYGYRPPEGYQVLGAWRHPKTRIFAFLLDNPPMKTSAPTIQLLLYVAGTTVEISILESKIEVLKANFELEDKKDRVDSSVGERLDRIYKYKSKSLAVLLGVLGIFTAIINGLSLYLRKLAPPELGSQKLILAYNGLLVLVHFVAVLLLLLVIVICAVFVIKYGVLLIRRL